jgi:hypothetical protein
MRRFRGGWLLAALSLLGLAQPAQAQRYGHPKNFGKAARDAINQDLYEGQVHDLQPFHGRDHTHEIFTGWLHNPNTGRTRHVFVKPHRPEQIYDPGSWEKPTGEIVAHKIDVALRGAYVPPAAPKRGIHLPDGRYYEFGTVALSVANHESSWQRNLGSVRPWHHHLVASDLAVRWALLGNPDGRWGPNTVIADHWVDGQRGPVAMDWSALLADHVSLDSYNPLWQGRMEKFNLATYLGLKGLSAQGLKEDLQDSVLPSYLADWQVGRILEARGGIVRYIEDLSRQRGAQNVFFRNERGEWLLGYGWTEWGENPP